MAKGAANSSGSMGTGGFSGSFGHIGFAPGTGSYGPLGVRGGSGGGGPVPKKGTSAQRRGDKTGKAQTLVNLSKLLGNMQTSQEGVPYKVLVGDPNEDPGHLRPPTQQDIDYGNRLQRAVAQKETGMYPTGLDPVLAEQRITAAERQLHGPRYKKDIVDPLRAEQYGEDTLQNMGNFLEKGYSGTLGKMVPFAHLPGGAIYNSRWSNRPNEALPMRRANILRGEGTIQDKVRAGKRAEAGYRHKYYGTPEPGPRKSNVYDSLGMPQPKPGTPSYDVGQKHVPPYLREMGLRAEQDLGPYKTPPPGSDWGLPAGALITRGLSTAPYLKGETRQLIKDGYPVQDLPPGVQRFVKSTMEKPKTTFFDDYPDKKSGDEEKKTFNLLEMLLRLLGINVGDKNEKSQRREALPTKSMETKTYRLTGGPSGVSTR